MAPSLNPWVAIETAVTRKAPGGVGEGSAVPRKVSLEEI
jgi:predicted amidohydrolase YtcJ